MIQSMTGYGKSECEICEKKLVIEIKSLNSKQLDLSLKMPSFLREKEQKIRTKILNRATRGKIDLMIYFNSTAKNTANQINTEILKSYADQIKEASKILNISEPDDPWPLLLHFPDVLKSENIEITDEEWDTIDKNINTALDEFTAFRVQEGNMLQKDLSEKVTNIETLLSEIEKYEEERIEKVRKRIHDELIESGITNYDKNRFEQEIIYYIEKLDINEEKKRLANHCKYFKKTLEEKSGQGKKLGFISQEIGREINTMGSKSNHSEMQKIVVSMKDNLEKIKEQVLNVL